jgi:hypothetical protein
MDDDETLRGLKAGERNRTVYLPNRIGIKAGGEVAEASGMRKESKWSL